MTETPQNITVLQAAGAMGRLVPQIAGIAIALSAVAYYAGWRDASAYFTELGAPWVVSAIPATAFLYSAAELVVVVLLAAFFSIHALATNSTTPKGLRRISLGVFITSALLVGIARVPPNAWLSTSNAWSCAAVGGALFASGAGITLAELANSLSEHKLKWSASHAYLVYLAIFVGLYSAPAQIGSARARYHLGAASAALPSIKMPNAPASQSWYLVATMADKVLAMERSSAAQRPQFRVIAASDLLSINAVIQ